MSVLRPTATDRAAASDLARRARTVLALPASAHLAVEDVEHLDAGDLALCDLAGVPTLGCPADSPLARAAAEGRGAVLTVTGGLADHPGLVTVVGRLRTLRVERCSCPCDDGERHVVRLEPRYVALELPGEARRRVPMAAFSSPEHALNPGYLARALRHANTCHADLLRETLATATGRAPGEIITAEISGLTPSGLEVTWVDAAGAHRRGLAFPRTAADADDLALLMRGLLHVGLR